MKVGYGDGTTKFGPGVSIDLTGDEIAIAISAYLVAHKIFVTGPRTISVNNSLYNCGHIYVAPSGFVIHEGEKLSGRGPEKREDVS